MPHQGLPEGRNGACDCPLPGHRMRDIRADVEPTASFGWWEITLMEDLCGKWYAVRQQHDDRRLREWRRPTRLWATWKARRELRRYQRERKNRFEREAFAVSDDKEETE